MFLLQRAGRPHSVYLKRSAAQKEEAPLYYIVSHVVIIVACTLAASAGGHAGMLRCMHGRCRLQGCDLMVDESNYTAVRDCVLANEMCTYPVNIPQPMWAHMGPCGARVCTTHGGMLLLPPCPPGGHTYADVFHKPMTIMVHEKGLESVNAVTIKRLHSTQQTPSVTTHRQHSRNPVVSSDNTESESCSACSSRSS